MTRRILVGLALSAITIGVSCARDGHPQPRAATPEACARRLHIAYDREQGATEKLDAFKACVR